MNSISAADVTFPPSKATPLVARPASPTAGVAVSETTGVSPTVASPAPAKQPDVSFALSRIQEMLDGCGASNRNDLLVIAIDALIEAGVNTGPRIVAAARSLGFHRGHAGTVLTKSDGGNPARHRWQRGADGIYRVHAARLAA